MCCWHQIMIYSNGGILFLHESSELESSQYGWTERKQTNSLLTDTSFSNDLAPKDSRSHPILVRYLIHGLLLSLLGVRSLLLSLELVYAYVFIVQGAQV
jgi:hypothetical protein